MCWPSNRLPAPLVGLAFERRACSPGPRRDVAQKRRERPSGFWNQASYTPTIRALSYARRPATSNANSGPSGTAGPGEPLLVVAMPSTPGGSDLPGARAEADMLLQRFPGRTIALVGAAATHEAVTRELPRAAWAHFSCHGQADLADPSSSSLLLHDHKQHPLTVTDIARLHLEHTELAFLSACSTARPGALLSDEAIHLTSAFQLAGYRHVIGTLWPIRDKPAAQLASDLYEALASNESTSTVPAAIHEVTRQLRDRRLRTPSVWSSHIRAGA